ncbi:hypothetical protein [Ekhidna sp.]|uniref:Vgb family protein n=1 Tax=Ekhidna sp. TaxID=2608089 RepID=UPI0032997FC9
MESFTKILNCTCLIVLISLVTNSLVLGQELSYIMLDKEINADGILITNNGVIYAAEGWDGSKIYKIKNGQVEVFASNLQGPIDIIMGKDGNLYVSEWMNGNKKGGRISKISSKGKVTTFAEVKPGPGLMTIDIKGNIYVTHNINDGSGFISIIDQNGQVIIIISDPLLVNPGGIDFDDEGNLYVANFNNGNIIKITDGIASVFAKISSNKQWRISYLKFIKGNLYVAGLQNFKIYKIDLHGQIGFLFDAENTNSELVNKSNQNNIQPDGLAFDRKNNVLYFTELFTKSDRIQTIKLK